MTEVCTCPIASMKEICFYASMKGVCCLNTFHWRRSFHLVKVSSSYKRDHISITKQPRRFYYMAQERESCLQGNVWKVLSICHIIALKNAIEKLNRGRPFPILHSSICHVIVTEKCQRKVKSRATILDPTQETNTVSDGGGSRATWWAQTTPKTGDNKSFGED